MDEYQPKSHYEHLVDQLNAEKEDSELLETYLSETLDYYKGRLKEIPCKKDKIIYLQKEVIDTYMFLIGHRDFLYCKEIRHTPIERRAIKLEIMQKQRLIHELDMLDEFKMGSEIYYEIDRERLKKKK